MKPTQRARRSCCIDAIAAGQNGAEKGKFTGFVEKHFPILCEELNGTVKGKSGAETLYEQFRNGFAHLRGPKSGFAIAENHELNGRYAGELEVEEVGKFTAINVDRFIGDFLRMLDDLESKTA